MEHRPVTVAPARLRPWRLGTLLIAMALIGGLGALLSSAPASARSAGTADSAGRRASGHDLVAAIARAEQETETPTGEPTDETATPEETDEPTETPEPTETSEPTETPETTEVPPGTATMTVLPETPGAGRDDDDKDRLGYIKGVAFIDLDQDGVLDPDDPGLNDVAVRLVGGGLDLVIITGSTGQFSFDGLGAGRYDVFVAPGPEWRVTTRSRYDGVRVRHDVVQGIDFGLARVGVPPAADGKPKAGKPSLPKTGLASMPTAGLLALATVVLGAIAATGLAIERRG